MPKLVLNPSSPHRREIVLSQVGALTIGRDPTNDLVLKDALVSRRHAVVEQRAGVFYLRDCRSANGSVVNGERVDERGLRNGDVVAIGVARLVFREDPPDSADGKVVQHPSVVWPRCQACGAEYRRGDVFCRDCGAQVDLPSALPKEVCASCGAAVPLPARFCSGCGAALAGEVQDGLESGPLGVMATAPAAALSALGAGASGLAAEPVGLEDPAASVPETPAPEQAQSSPARAARGDVELAEPGSRLAAALVDGVFIGSAQALMLAPVLWYWWAREAPKDAADVLFLPVLASVSLVPLALLVGALYHVYFWTAKGATPGKELLDLSVQCDDGSAIGPGRAALRVLGYALCVASLGVGFLIVAFGGAGLHDRISHTRVVKARRA